MRQIKDIACYERPREKALKLGINNLSDIELFALIIQSGGKNNSVLNIAYNLIDKSNGLGGFLEYDYEGLLAIKGINKVTAIKLLAIKELTESCKNRPKSKDENKVTFRASSCMYCKYSNTSGTICKKPMKFYCYLDELTKKSNRDLVSEF